MNVKCKLCDKETSNPKFCSRSCAVTFNNKNQPKRKLKNKCKTCKASIRSRSTYCKPCFLNRTINLKLTLKDLKYEKGFKSNRYTKVRDHARRVAKRNNLLKQCKNCSYAKHVIACHIKPISSFPDTATIAEINNISNLIGLCPNCHWELDHNLLKVDA